MLIHKAIDYKVYNTAHKMSITTIPILSVLIYNSIVNRTIHEKNGICNLCHL
jgi:hypothetical protein